MGVLGEEVGTFEKRTIGSAKLFREALTCVPFGVHSNYRHVDPYPLYMKAGRGTRLWDADGNEYLDFNMGFGALVTGHAHPVLVRAMADRVANGTMFGFESSEMPDLAKHLCHRFRQDRIKLNTTGAEAASFAVRLARAHTWRRKLLKFEGCYHGSQDGLLVSVKPPRARAGPRRKPTAVPSSRGLPPEVTRDVVVAPFNDLRAVEALVREHGPELAAIILEPIPMNMGCIVPVKGFLEGLRRLCDEHDLVLIFDEVKTSGKFYGGASDALGVRPDLAILGKAISGGYPMAAVAGRSALMDEVVPGQIAHAGTYNSNPLCVTAALVTLTKILTPEAMHRAEDLGNRLGRGYEQIAKDSGLRMIVNYMGISGQLHFTTKPVRDWRSFLLSSVSKWYFYHTAMLNRGIIPAGNGPDEQWTLSVQHSAEEVDAPLQAFAEVAGRIRRVEGEMPMVEAI
jgi:glutamate-1-semialdehyde 2,1-aminomutase